MKLKIIILLLLSMPIISMEAPEGYTGKKRPAAAVEQDLPMPESAPEKEARYAVQAEQTAALAHRLHAIENEVVGLGQLPSEMEDALIRLILTTHGPTRRARLYNAAENIRNYAMVGTAFYELMNDPRMTDFLIHELAQRYTSNNNLAEAAAALGTDSASRWLGGQVNEASVAVQTAVAANSEDQSAEKFLRAFSALLIDAIRDNQADAFRFLTANVPLTKLQVMLNGQQIHDKKATRMPFLVHTILHHFNEMTTLLLACKVNLDKQAADGTAPLHAAVITHNILVLDQLLADPQILVDATNKDDQTPLMLAVEEGYLPMVNRLLARGAQVNLLDVKGQSPLQDAVRNENVEVLRRLLQVPNIDVNLQAMPPEFDRVENVALHSAMETGSVEIVRLLLAAPGINVNTRGEEGFTPLHLAATLGNIAIINLLLDAGADINARSDEDQTPLMLIAEAEGDASRMVSLMLQRGANPLIEDNEGKSALWYAIQANNPKISRLLEDAELNA